jgi:hypothetical protein
MEWPVVVSPKGTVPRQNAEACYSSGLHCRGCIETLSASLSRQLTVDFDYVWFVPSGAVKDDCATEHSLPCRSPSLARVNPSVFNPRRHAIIARRASAAQRYGNPCLPDTPFIRTDRTRLKTGFYLF